MDLGFEHFLGDGINSNGIGEQHHLLSNRA